MLNNQHHMPKGHQQIFWVKAIQHYMFYTYHSKRTYLEHGLELIIT